MNIYLDIDGVQIGFFRMDPYDPGMAKKALVF